MSANFDNHEEPKLDPKLFALDHTMSLKALKKEIGQLALSADMKALIIDLAGFTIKVAGKVVELGRKILQVALALLRAFPNTAFGAITGLILGRLIAKIPVLGQKLSTFFTPLLVMLGVGKGAIMDLASGALGRNMDAFIDAVADVFGLGSAELQA
ncbi:hypothetical protein [Pseudothioclava arenosa]|uniref:Uncharacterized protein n=1 Tax=Pseudothioclava arenosa TaxID=1795308 RepID=A0A2A4CQ93_9RHOB|nr:hypothetical protein [Pseudothioclava arenosa]PCD78143.1 hypothetical protein CLN94_02255 [Pseudothioclava arenosa]